jgi:hypothetical protein
LIRNAEPIGVYPEFRASLNLKWARPAGPRPVNLGYILADGAIWTDFPSRNVPPEIARTYVEELTTAFGCQVHTMPNGTAWTPSSTQGKPLRVQQVRDRLQAWIPVMQRFITAISKLDEAA